MDELLDEDGYPNVEYPALVDYAERVMDGQLEESDWMGLHEMADANPDLFPSGGISENDAHVVEAIMSLTTVIYSWPTQEEVLKKLAEDKAGRGGK